MLFADYILLVNKLIFLQVNSSKSVEKDVKLLKSKMADEQMLEKSLEAKLVEYQAKGLSLVRFQPSASFYLRCCFDFILLCFSQLNSQMSIKIC